MKKIIRIILAILIAFLMCTIFYLSAQKAEESQGTSSSVIKTIVRIIHSDFDSWSEERQMETIESYQHLVRKLAHMSEYALLGILSSCFALTFDFKIKNMVFAFLFSAGYAASDEFHQRFVPGRSGQLSDVMIDSSGAVLGIIFVLMIYLIIKLIIRKKAEKDG